MLKSILRAIARAIKKIAGGILGIFSGTGGIIEPDDEIILPDVPQAPLDHVPYTGPKEEPWMKPRRKMDDLMKAKIIHQYACADEKMRYQIDLDELSPPERIWLGRLPGFILESISMSSLQDINRMLAGDDSAVPLCQRPDYIDAEIAATPISSFGPTGQLSLAEQMKARIKAHAISKK